MQIVATAINFDFCSQLLDNGPMRVYEMRRALSHGWCFLFGLWVIANCTNERQSELWKKRNNPFQIQYSIKCAIIKPPHRIGCAASQLLFELSKCWRSIPMCVKASKLCNWFKTDARFQSTSQWRNNNIKHSSQSESIDRWLWKLFQCKF